MVSILKIYKHELRMRWTSGFTMDIKIIRRLCRLFQWNKIDLTTIGQNPKKYLFVIIYNK